MFKLVTPGTYTVYLLESPEGKGYVGKTKGSLKRRWKNGRNYQHNTALTADIERLGWENFHKTIIAEGLSAQKADFMEALSIAKYHTLAPSGYNLQGGGSRGYTSRSRRTRPVVQINLETGEYKLWPSAAVAGRKLGIDSRRISDIARGVRNPRWPFTWVFADEWETIENVVG